MKYLLDTSVWLRAAIEPETLPLELRRLLQALGAEFGLAAISLWEVGKKHQIGKLDLRLGLREWLAAALPAQVVVLPLTPEVVVAAMALPDFPNRDPADELIVATARVHGLTLLTTDRALRHYAHAEIRYFTPLAAKP